MHYKTARLISKLRTRPCAVSIILVCVAMLLTATVFAFRAAPYRSGGAVVKIPRPPATQDKSGIQRKSPGEAILIDLTAKGFEPDGFTLPTGKFLLGVNNRSGVSDLTFWLVGGSGESEGEKRVVREKVWRKVLNLSPGNYVLGVTGHPEWRCQITIKQD